MKIQEENIVDVLDEIEPRLTGHIEETEGPDYKMSMNKDLYDIVGEGYATYVLRDEGLIVGYVGYFIYRHPHFDFVSAAQDGLYINTNIRKTGWGYKLISYSEESLKNKGVDKVYQTSKVIVPADKLFNDMGYTFIERVYQKGL